MPPRQTTVHKGAIAALPGTGKRRSPGNSARLAAAVRLRSLLAQSHHGIPPGLPGALLPGQQGAHRHWKVLTSEPMSRFQPSIRMNSKILNGREIMTGGSIIMPMASRMEATTMSRIKNGM